LPLVEIKAIGITTSKQLGEAAEAARALVSQYPNLGETAGPTDMVVARLSLF